MLTGRPHRLPLFCLMAVALTGVSFSGFAIQPAHAAGIVYVAPSGMPAKPLGWNVTFAIFVSGMDGFNAFDVYVSVNKTVLQPISINDTSTVLEYQTTKTASCVNGTGLGCTKYDGPGIMHAGLSGSTAPINPPFAGQLFTITLKVVGGPGTFIHPFNDTITSSVNGLPVSHTTTPGTYGNPGEFGFSSPAPFYVPLNGSNSTQMSITSENGFSGAVNLTGYVPYPASYFLTVTIQPSQVNISPTAQAIFTVTVTSAHSLGSYAGSYTVNIVGASGYAYNSTSFTVTIPQVYLLTTIQYPAGASQGQQINLQTTFSNWGELPVQIASVTLTSDFGTFNLFSAKPAGITLCGQTYLNTIDIMNGQASRALNMTIPANAALGNHTFTITVTWQYQTTMILYNNPITVWCDTQPLLLHRSMMISANSNPPASPPGIFGGLVQLWPYLLGGLLAAALSAVLAVVLIRKRSSARPSPTETVPPWFEKDL